MSAHENMDKDELMDRVTVSPEPDDAELVAILQALELLTESEAAEGRAPAPESEWSRLGRTGSLRARNWPGQVRSWSTQRS